MRGLAFSAWAAGALACSPELTILNLPYPALEARTLVLVEGPVEAPTRLVLFERNDGEAAPVVQDIGASSEVRVVAYDASLSELSLVGRHDEVRGNDFAGPLPGFGRTFRLMIGPEATDSAAWIEEASAGSPLPALRVPQRARPSVTASVKLYLIRRGPETVSFDLCLEPDHGGGCIPTVGDERITIGLVTPGVETIVAVNPIPTSTRATYPPHLATVVAEVGVPIDHTLDVAASELLAENMAILGITPDPTRGHLYFRLRADPARYLADARVVLEGDPPVGYIGDETVVIDPSLSGTDSVGAGWAFNLPAGELSARFTAGNGPCTGSTIGWHASGSEIYRTMIRPGTVTVLPHLYCY